MARFHDDVIKRKHLPRYWPFVRLVTRSFDVYFDLYRNKRLSKQSRCWWCCPLWRHCYVVVESFGTYFAKMANQRHIIPIKHCTLNVFCKLSAILCVCINELIILICILFVSLAGIVLGMDATNQRRHGPILKWFFLQEIWYSAIQGQGITETITETEMSSFWWNFHHWLHWKLSKWQLPVQPVMKISSKWRHFRFSDGASPPIWCIGKKQWQLCIKAQMFPLIKCISSL